MFYEAKPFIHVIGQLLVAFLFLGTGIANALWKQQQHIDRMAAYGVPFPQYALWAGFVLQFAGGAMVALDWYTRWGAGLLIIFTVLASAIFHRYWTVQDPLRRHLHISFLFSNTAVIGALLLLM